MTTLTLKRFSYSPTETEGRLWLDDETCFFTLERPWIDRGKGGMPFESCVPDGTYELLRHERPDGSKVLALWNPDLGVFYDEQEKGDQEGRFLILIHPGNYVEDVVGCIAPGHGRTIYKNERMVTNSRKAMARIMDADPDRLIIEPDCGTHRKEIA